MLTRCVGTLWRPRPWQRIPHRKTRLPPTKGRYFRPSPRAPGPKGKEQPSYELTFTCKPCSARSTHTISKQGYHNGTVLIKCPSCSNRHVISDHLKIFADKAFTIEDIMRQKGDLVKKGSLDSSGSLEMWDDGTSRPRIEHHEKTNHNHDS